MRIFYTYRITIYRASTQSNDIYSYLRADNVSVIEIASNVKALYWSAPETASPTNIGRNKDDDKLSLERVKVPAGTDIQDGDIIKFTAPATFPNVNQFYAVKGNAQSHTSLLPSNCIAFYIVGINTPLIELDLGGF